MSYPNGEYRYFFAKLSQDSNGLLNARLELDDYTNNYNDISVGAIANVERASLDQFEVGSGSLINIPENVGDPKVMVNTINFNFVDPLNEMVPYRPQLEAVVNSETWVYYYVKPNSFITGRKNYSVDGVDTQLMVFCAPLSSKWTIRRRTGGTDQNPTYQYIDWNVAGIKAILETYHEVPAQNSNMDIIRLVQNSGLPASVTKIDTTLMPFVSNIKISAMPPYTANPTDWGFNIYYDFQTSKVVVTDNLLQIQPIIGGYGGATELINNALSIVKSLREYRFNVKIPPFDLGKFMSTDFIEYRITNHKGDYFTVDLTKVNLIEDHGDKYLPVTIYEELSADATDNYMFVGGGRVTDNYGYFYKYSAINYHGLVSNTDTAIPMFIDALSDYFATNKNSIASNELERQAIQMSADSQKRRIDDREANQWQSVQGFTTSVASLGTRQLENTDEKKALQREANIAKGLNAARESYTYDNLKYSPPKVSGAGSVVFNKRIFTSLLPRIDIFKVEEIVIDKYKKYFENFGYKIGQIYDLALLDGVELSKKYLQCNILGSDAELSDLEFSRLNTILNAGVLRSTEL
jgi:hypothetical protein